MKETIFTMKKGKEVPDRFDGTTVPILEFSSVSEAQAALPEERLLAIVNGAYTLNVQKNVKTAAAPAFKDDEKGRAVTVDTLRAIAAREPKAQYPDKVRERGDGTATPKEPGKIKKMQAALDATKAFAATLPAEFRDQYIAKMRELGQWTEETPTETTNRKLDELAPATEPTSNGGAKRRPAGAVR